MKNNKFFSNKELLTKELEFFKSKNQIKVIPKNKELVHSHIEKAKHNLKFYQLNKTQTGFKDWLIVILYYTLHHCALALIINKQFNSKNHHATILLLISEYSISEEDTRLFYELSISKEDAQLYTHLKKDRHRASYTTNTIFSKEKIIFYENKVKEFINKTEILIEK